MTISELLINIIDAFVESLCVSYLMLSLISIINKNAQEKTKNTVTIIKFCLITLLVVIINKTIHIYLPNLRWLKFITFTIFSTINCSICYNVKLYKSFIISVLVLIISSILEVIVVLILKGFHISPEKISNSTYFNCLNACILALLEALVGFILTRFNKPIAYDNNKLNLFMPQLIAIIICIIPTMILLIINDFENSEIFIIINVIQLIVVSLVGIFNLKFVANHEKTELELANTITYNETLKKVNDGVRGFKHDMGNIVQAILGYIAINDSEGAKEYCQNLVIGFNDINILSILSPKVIDEPAIYGIVVNKILLAREKNLSLSLDVTTTVSEINFPKFELSRILGVLIDNAIEASENTEEKKLIVNMRKDYYTNADIIVISNSTNNVDININEIFEKNYSTKANPSGFGLYEVTKFLNKYPQAFIHTNIDKENKLFTQTLTIQ